MGYAYETTQIVIRLEDVYTFVTIPRESLSAGQVLRFGKFVFECNKTWFYLEVVPQLLSQGLVARHAILGLMDVGNGERSSERGCHVVSSITTANFSRRTIRRGGFFITG